MPPTQPLSQKFQFILANGFNGGLSSENPIAIDRSKLVNADNILVATVPTRRKRGGMELYSTSTFQNTASYPVSGVPIRGIDEYWRTASNAGNPTADIFLHQANKVWSIDDRNTKGVDRTGALVLSSDGVPSYQVFNQSIYFTSTITADGYNKWDGFSASAVAANAPADGPGKYLGTHIGRMIMTGNNDFPFRVYYSAAFDPESWTTISGGGSFDLDADGDPEGITGHVSFQNRLYVFTRQSTYEITGSTAATFAVLRVSNGIGCVSHASIATVPNDVIFASDRGVHSIKQLDAGRQTESTFLSRDIQRLWTSLINATRFKQCQAMYSEDINCYLISVVSGADTTNSDVFVYNIEFGTWTQWKDINARAISSAMISNKKNIIIGRENGQIAFLNRPSRTDFGSVYNAQFETGMLYPGELGREKVFKNVTLWISTDAASTINVNWNIDGRRSGMRSYPIGSNNALLGSTFILGQSALGIAQYLPYTVSIDDIGYGIQLTVQLTGPGDIEVYGFILEVEDANPNYATSTL